MLTTAEVEKWNTYALDRLRRYQEDEADPIINIRDVLRQGKSGQYIWELLQNAEDAQATNVTIKLNRDSLTFEHDGKLTFTYKDAVAISKIGFTGKNDKPAIGQFGVGFKSVFKYARRVEVHTGEINFALEDYIKILNNIDFPRDEIVNKSNTLFKVMFEEKLIAAAYEESKELLESLNQESILFLKFLRKISIEFAMSEKTITKKECPGFITDIEIIENRTTSNTYWYCKTQDFIAELRDGNSETKGTRETYLGFAFQLTSPEINIEPISIENAKIFTYFPLADQVSNLKFHVHAPFVINLARTMLDTEEKNNAYNQQLVQFISMFLVSDLLHLHSKDALPESLLAILPIPADGLPAILTNIGKSVYEIFQNNNMIKVSHSIKANPNEVFQASQDVIEMIGVSGLNIFNDAVNSKFRRVDPKKRSAGKYFLPMAQSARVSSFLRHIGVARIDNEKLSDFFSELNYIMREDNSEDSRSSFLSNLLIWLESKKDPEIRGLYEIIAKIQLQKNKLNNLPLFRTYGDGSDSHLKLDQVFLSSTLEQQDHDVIKSSIFFKEHSRSEKLEQIEEFFNNLGLEEKDPWVVLKHSLKKEHHPDGKDKELDRMIQFLHFYREDKDRFLRLAKGSIDVVATKPDGKEYWVKPKDVYVDTKDFPFSRLNSEALESEKLPALWNGYAKTDEFLNMVRDLGVNFGLNTVGEGARLTVTFLQTIIESKDLVLLKILWSFIQRMEYSDFKIVYLKNIQSETKVFEILIASAWIPQIDGIFTTPYECNVEKLSEGFTEYNGVFFQISDFGRKILDEKLKSEEANVLAKNAGFESAEYMEIAARLAQQYSLEDLRKLDKTDRMNEMQAVKDFEGVVKDSKEREISSPNISHESEQTVIRTSYDSAQELRKEQLKKLYGTANGNVSCQMCNLGQMPFKAPRGEDNVEWDYFEAVALFKKYRIESSVNVIALCPTCSAKIKFFRQTDPSFSDRRIASEISRLKGELDSDLIDSNSEIFFEFYLLGSNHTMKFNKQHLLLLYGLIESKKEDNA